MIFVADASSINYLVLIEQIDVLPALFERILLPLAVHDELRDSGAPVAVQDWAVTQHVRDAMAKYEGEGTYSAFVLHNSPTAL